MKTFYINTLEAEKMVSILSSISDDLYKRSDALQKIYDTIYIGTATETVKESISAQIDNLNTEAARFANLSGALDQIVEHYKQTETAIITFILPDQLAFENPAPVNTPSGPTDNTAFENPSGDFTTPEERESFYKNIADKFGIDEKYLEIIMFVLGLIPGVNIIVDVMDFLNDLSKYTADDKLTIGEATALAADIAFLIGDVMGFASLVKALNKGAKAVKAADTAAKVASETAEGLAEKAEKEAAEVVSKAQKSVDITKANKAATEAKKIGKNAKDVRAADKGYRKSLDNLADAKKEAKKIRKGAQKEGQKVIDEAKKAQNAAKESYDKTIKDAYKNPYKHGENAINNKLKSSLKDQVSELGEDHYYDMKNHKIVWE